jgi:hypothetical protein
MADAAATDFDMEDIVAPAVLFRGGAATTLPTARFGAARRLMLLV